MSCLGRGRECGLISLLFGWLFDFSGLAPDWGVQYDAPCYVLFF